MLLARHRYIKTSACTRTLNFVLQRRYLHASNAMVEGRKDAADAEQVVKRNPHPDFGKTQASRPDFRDHPFDFTKTKQPDWKLGGGGNDGGESLKKQHIEIDPYEEGRPAGFNYKLLISGILPRPVGFMSTRSADGTSTNLAPFSYFQVLNHDPPVFVIGCSGGFDKAKDTLRNLKDTGEGCVNIISEHYAEAANSCSINAPYGVSEWALSGLHPAPCTTIKASRVKESIFSIECKVMNFQEFESRATPGKKTGVMVVLEGVRFWVREDAINDEKNLVDPAVSQALSTDRAQMLTLCLQVLRPIARLGGISYGRLVEAFEILRPDFDKDVKEQHAEGLVKPKADGQ